MKKTITGITGYPLHHTLSPVMHNAVFKKYNMNWEYSVFETKPKKLAGIIRRVRKEGMRGINVTIPHKQSVMKYLDKTDKAAATIGAVNTVVNDRGRLTGFNTDYIGFGKSLKKSGIRIKGKKVVMLGAGGAAHAVGYMIKLAKPSSFHIYNIDVPMIKRLVRKLKLKNVKTGDIAPSAEKDDVLAAADFIVNTTSVGMDGRSVPYDLRKLKRGAAVMDIIYNPAKTPMLKKASRLGAKTVNGLDMLIYQGMESFRYWTGRKSDYQTVKKALDLYFRGRK